MPKSPLGGMLPSSGSESSEVMTNGWRSTPNRDESPLVSVIECRLSYMHAKSIAPALSRLRMRS